MISVENLNKSIQDKPILQSIDVTIQKGRLTSLIDRMGPEKYFVICYQSVD